MPNKSKKRRELLDLAKEIQEGQDVGRDVTGLIAKFGTQVSYPKCEDLFRSDHSAEHIVDFVLGWTEQIPGLSEAEMLDLVKRLLSAKGTAAEIDLMVRVFEANCVHPAKSDLLFWPDDYFDGNDNPTPEQIVAKAKRG